jgi:hypothetical protein
MSKGDAKEILEWAKDFVREMKKYLVKEKFINSK